MRIFLKERDQIADLNMRNSSSDRSHHCSSLQISSSQNSTNTISANSNSSDNSQRNFRRLSQIFGDYYEDQMLQKQTEVNKQNELIHGNRVIKKAKRRSKPVLIKEESSDSEEILDNNHIMSTGDPKDIYKQKLLDKLGWSTQN